MKFLEVTFIEEIDCEKEVMVEVNSMMILEVVVVVGRLRPHVGQLGSTHQTDNEARHGEQSPLGSGAPDRLDWQLNRSGECLLNFHLQTTCSVVCVKMNTIMFIHY